MNFDFTPEQLMLRQMTRELLAGECPPPVVRRLMDDPAGYREETWRQLAELGLLGITIPEAYGGQGLGAVELALVLEEMGRAVYPGPYFASVVLAATALLAGGSEAQRERYLTGIAAGSTKATLALWEEDAAWGGVAPGAATSPRRTTRTGGEASSAARTRWGAQAGWPGARGAGTVARATPDGGSYVLRGTKRLVPYAHVADVLLVAARIEEGESNGTGGSDGGLTLFAVERETPGVEVRPLGTIDQTTRVGEVVLDDVEVGGDQIVGPVGGALPILEEVLRQAAVGASAEMLGAARKALEMSVEYARSREQFGQPIGSFQAVKHTCAGMLLEVEQAHAATYYAAWALSAGAPDAALAASVAKAYVGGAARKVCGDAIQVHGGIGFTWEFDLHLYFKRAKHLEPLYGDADFHRERALALTLAGEGAGEAAPVGARESAIAG